MSRGTGESELKFRYKSLLSKMTRGTPVRLILSSFFSIYLFWEHASRPSFFANTSFLSLYTMSSRYQDSYEGSFQLQEPLEITQHHGHINLLPPDPNHPNMNFGVPRKPRGRARRVEQPWNSRMSQFSASMITAGPPNSNQQCAAPHKCPEFIKSTPSRSKSCIAMTGCASKVDKLGLIDMDPLE
jgi:hypothetical protein